MTLSRKSQDSKDPHTTGHTLNFKSFRFSDRYPVVPDPIFCIETLDPTMIDHPECNTFRKEYIGSLEKTKNYLIAQIENHYQIPKEDATQIASNSLDRICAFEENLTPILQCDPDGKTTIMPIHHPTTNSVPMLTLYEPRWVHTTVWGETVFLRAGKIEVDQFLLTEDSQHHRCILPNFYELEYSINSKTWKKIGNSFYGTPYMLIQNKITSHRNTQSIIRSKFFIPMATYENLSSGLAAMNAPHSIDFTCVIDEVFGPQQIG